MHAQQSPGPWIRLGAKVRSEKVTVRVTIPCHYRIKLFSDKASHEKPGEILANPAAILGIPSHRLGGGQWRGETLRHRDQLVGYLKVCKTTAEALQKASGRFGVFTNMIQSHRRSEKVLWFKRREDEDDDSYYRRCLTDAKDKGLILKHRSGGASDLGRTLTPQESHLKNRLWLGSKVSRDNGNRST